MNTKVKVIKASNTGARNRNSLDLDLKRVAAYCRERKQCWCSIWRRKYRYFQEELGTQVQFIKKLTGNV